MSCLETYCWKIVKVETDRIVDGRCILYITLLYRLPATIYTILKITSLTPRLTTESRVVWGNKSSMCVWKSAVKGSCTCLVLFTEWVINWVAKKWNFAMQHRVRRLKERLIRVTLNQIKVNDWLNYCDNLYCPSLILFLYNSFDCTCIWRSIITTMPLEKFIMIVNYLWFSQGELFRWQIN